MPKAKPSNFRLNFAIVIELIAVVMIWRGTWMLLDHYLFPNWPFLSAVVGVVVGLLLLLLDDRLLKELKHWL